MPKVNDNIFTTSSLRFEKQKLVLSALRFNLVWWHIFLFAHKLQKSSSAKLKCRPFFYEFTCCVEGLALKISQFHNLFYYCLAISFPVARLGDSSGDDGRSYVSSPNGTFRPSPTL